MIDAVRSLFSVARAPARHDVLCIVAAFAVACVSCTTKLGPSLSWTFSFASPATAGRASHVDVSIVRGTSCSGGQVVYQAELGRSGSVAAPPQLAPGKYALVGRAVSDDCKVIASGCMPITLPAKSGMQYQVMLDDAPESAECEGSCAAACADAGDINNGHANGDGDSTGDGDALDAGKGGDGDAPDGSSPTPDGGGTTPDGGDTSDAGDPSCVNSKSEFRRPQGHCYRFVSATLAWQGAEADCVAWGGHLVAFNDSDEELWVYQATMGAGFGDSFSYWIGFSDAQTETLWYWTDGSTNDSTGTGPSIVSFKSDDAAEIRFKVPLDDVYTHWGPNLPKVGNAEPNNGSSSDPFGQNPGEDCAQVSGTRHDNPGGGTPRPSWDDQACSKLKSYTCER
jgi:hypothetical protein